MFQKMKKVDDNAPMPADVQEKLKMRVGMIVAWVGEMEKQQRKMQAMRAMKKALEGKVKKFVDDMLENVADLHKGGGEDDDDDDEKGDDKYDEKDFDKDFKGDDKGEDKDEKGEDK